MADPANKNAPHGTTFADALVRVSSSVAEAWNSPLPEALETKWRFAYALAGSFTWMLVHLEPDTLSEYTSIFGDFGAIVGLLARASLGAWFAWLISFQNRRCSPSRFFLEGLLFPGVAAGILSAGSLLGKWMEG